MGIRDWSYAWQPKRARVSSSSWPHHRGPLYMTRSKQRKSITRERSPLLSSPNNIRAVGFTRDGNQKEYYRATTIPLPYLYTNLGRKREKEREKITFFLLRFLLGRCRIRMEKWYLVRFRLINPALMTRIAHTWSQGNTWLLSVIYYYSHLASSSTHLQKTHSS